MTEEVPIQASEELADIVLPDDAIRSDLVDRTLQSLLEDAERCEGELARGDINRAYFRRKLTISECAEVEKQLSHRTINIVEGEEEDADDTEELVRINSIPLPAKAYLTEAEEVDCGRKISCKKTK